MDLPENKIYTIGEAAKAVGVSISTLRRWDKEGKVKIGRKSNGYRAFTEAEVLLLKQTQTPWETVPNIPPPRTVQPYLRLSNHTRHLFLALFILVFLLAIGNIFLLAKTDYPHQAVLGVETFVAPVVAEEGPIGSLISKIGSLIRQSPVSSFALTIVQKVEEPLQQGKDLNVKGNARIGKDIEGLGNLNIKGTAKVGKLVTQVIDPYLVENDGTIQSTLEIKSKGDIKLEPGTSNIDLTDSSLSNVNNITSGGTITSNNLTILNNGTIGGSLTTTQGAVIGTSLETKKDLTVDGNITLTGVINSNTFSSTNLTFAGNSPSISAGTTNTGISLNGNGTGAISIGNSSTGDIYLGGGTTSTTYCLISNSTANVNCTGDITSGGNLTANGGYLKTSSTTGYLFNTTATTLNIGGAATTVSLGASTGTTTINNGLTITGTGTLNGNVVLGQSSSQTLAFNAKVTTSILPNLTGNVDLGSSSLKWNNLYSNTINTAAINTSGQGIFNQNPASTAITDASLLINPTTVSNAGSALLGIAVGGTEKARIDETGKLTLQGGLNVAAGTVTLPSSSITASSLNPGTAGQLLLSSSTPTATWTTLSGDATLSSTGALTLANSGVSANSYGGATAVPVLTIDSKGRITSATTASISSAWSSITNPTANLALTMAGYTTTLTYNAATGASTNLFTLTDTSSNTGTGYLLSANTAALSNLKPFQIQARGNAIVDTTALGVLTLGNTTANQNVQFFSSSNNITPSGALTVASTINAGGVITGPTTVNTINGAIINNGSITIQNLTINGSVQGNLTATGTLTGTQLISNIAQGTAPLTVTSTTMVTNLNSNYVGGLTSAQLTSSGQTIMPNLVLNSAFGRRNRWMTFMPETFADTSGGTALAGTIGTVASNLLTPPSNVNWAAKWGLSTWQDIRVSCQIKMTVTDGSYAGCGRYTSGTPYSSEYSVWAMLVSSGGANAFRLRKTVNNITTEVGATYTPVLNNFYWLELESQGTTYIAKLYSSGASAVAKSSATLVTTLTATITDAGIGAGPAELIAAPAVSTNLSFGGLSTGDGGVYVEGWGPESVSATWQGTLGGQAFGFDDTTDSGPIGRQWALRSYIPAASRGIEFDMPDNITGAGRELSPSTGYTLSMYEKVSGLGGSGALLWGYTREQTSAGAAAAYSTTINDAGETSWTRKSASSTTTASTAQGFVTVGVNYDRNAGTVKSATGTLFIDLLQLEQMSSVTPWRNAPADDDPIAWELNVASNATVQFTNAGAYGEVESRDLAANVFLPWDSNVDMNFTGYWQNDSNGGNNIATLYVDGTAVDSSLALALGDFVTATINTNQPFDARYVQSNSAGKHRIAARAGIINTGTLKILLNAVAAGIPRRPRVIITATRGKFDLAEEYSVNDPTIGAGDVVQLTSNNSQVASNTTIERSSGGYSSSVLGIVSTDPGITLSSQVELNGYQQRPNLRPVALSGRVPVKVTNENGGIRRGDTLTSSALYPGFAMKATRAGQSIGIAMEDFAPADNGSVQTGLITTFVNLSWYDPDVYLTDSGQFVINKAVENPTVQLASNGQVATSSAIPNSQFTISNSQTKETIDRVGAYNNLFVANLKVGSLDVSSITNDELKDIQTRLKNLELATSSAVLSSSISALLNNQPITTGSAVENFTVLNKLLTTDLGLTGKLTGGLLTINGLDSSISTPSATINTLNNDLYLQNLGVGGVNFLNGKVLIDKNGNLTVQGNLTGNKLILTQSANPSAGSATIPTGSTSVNINTTQVTSNSKIFVTPTSETGGQALIVKTKTPGIGFKVIIEKSFTSDIPFDWWVLDVK